MFVLGDMLGFLWIFKAAILGPEVIFRSFVFTGLGVFATNGSIPWYRVTSVLSLYSDSVNVNIQFRTICLYLRLSTNISNAFSCINLCSLCSLSLRLTEKPAWHQYDKMLTTIFVSIASTRLLIWRPRKPAHRRVQTETDIALWCSLLITLLNPRSKSWEVAASFFKLWCFVSCFAWHHASVICSRLLAGAYIIHINMNVYIYIYSLIQLMSTQCWGNYSHLGSVAHHTELPVCVPIVFFVLELSVLCHRHHYLNLWNCRFIFSVLSSQMHWMTELYIQRHSGSQLRTFWIMLWKTS